MALRIIVSLIALPLFFLVLYVFPPWALPTALTVLSVIAIHEMLGATGFVKNKAMLAAAMLFGAAVNPWVYIGAPMYFAYVALFIFICLLFAINLAKHDTVTFTALCGAFFAGLFIPFAFSSVLRIRTMENGVYLVLLPFLIAWSSDTFAYFAGVFLGKRKLAPAISPKKTIEGSIGGVVGAMGMTAVFVLVCERFFSCTFPLVPMLMAALIGSVISQFGDLCLSFIKRQFGIKDYGKIMPGHGGILDRFDSVLFSAPAVETMLTILIAVSLL